MADEKCGVPDVHHPTTLPCATDKGKLVADVVTFKQGVKKAKKSALPDVKVEIEGPTKKNPEQTGADALTPVIGDLAPGSYKLTLEPTDAQRESYDFEHSINTETKTVKADATQVYHFEVPFFWLDHEVKYAGTKIFAIGIEYILRHKKPVKGANFEALAGDKGSGKTAGKTVELEKIPRGRYKLDLKLVYDPAWGDKKVVIGKAIELRANVSGFDAGAKGSIEIYDIQDLAAKLHSIDVSVAAGDKGRRELKSNWTPTSDQLKNLKSGRVVFRAVVGTSATLSDPLSVFLREDYEIVDLTGKKLDTALELHLASGRLIKDKSTSGKAEVELPFNDPVSRINLPAQKGRHIIFEDTGTPARGFLIPK